MVAPPLAGHRPGVALSRLGITAESLHEPKHGDVLSCWSVTFLPYRVVDPGSERGGEIARRTVFGIADGALRWRRCRSRGRPSFPDRAGTDRASRRSGAGTCRPGSEGTRGRSIPRGTARTQAPGHAHFHFVNSGPPHSVPSRSGSGSDTILRLRSKIRPACVRSAGEMAIRGRGSIPSAPTHSVDGCTLLPTPWGASVSLVNVRLYALTPKKSAARLMTRQNRGRGWQPRHDPGMPPSRASGWTELQSTANRGALRRSGRRWEAIPWNPRARVRSRAGSAT
jgi:hypothetical protein